ncbi:hypothetical protein Tco_1386009 [Tanacetum coccineum]
MIVDCFNEASTSVTLPSNTIPKRIKGLLNVRNKLLELAKISLNENCSAMLLKKLPEKLGDPDKFLIPCNFPGMDSYRADPITYPKGLAEDVFVKVGKFHFPTDFVVVKYRSDLEYLLILWRSFFEDLVCEEYAPELLGFSNSSGGNPTLMSDPFTSEFILEEIEAYLKDDSISPKIDHADCDPEEDMWFDQKIVINDPFQLPPMDLKQSEVTEAKSLIEEPLELELKDLPSHLEEASWKETTTIFQIPNRSPGLEKTTLHCPLWKTFGVPSHAYLACVFAPGSENLAADHLSRLENPHKDVLENKDINEHFPLETLGVISSKRYQGFCGLCNINHAEDFIIKGMSTQQKRKFFKDVKHYFWDDPYLFRTCADQIISRCVYGPRKLLKILKSLSSEGPPGGHQSAISTARKVFDAILWSPTKFQGAKYDDQIL